MQNNVSTLRNLADRKHLLPIRKWFCTAVLTLGIIATPALAELPAVNFEKGELISPDDAVIFYGSNVAHTDRLCEIAPDSQYCVDDYRAPRLKSLALTLGKDRVTEAEYVQNIYEYIYLNIETEFRYGLSKGAYGAFLDQSGTAFDQAHLMVELLREGGVPASYEAGTITISSEQFIKWTGFYNNFDETSQAGSVLASTACTFMADGGIPASCSGGAGNLSDLTLSTAWVVVNGKRYNPSYKTHHIKAAKVDLEAAAGCGTTCGQQVMDAGLNGKISSDSTGRFARNINDAAIGSKLKSYAVNIQNAIMTQVPHAGLDDIIGGKDTPKRAQLPEASTALPYPSNVQHSWAEAIPDQYRTRLGIQFDNLELGDGTSGQEILEGKSLFADEIYGANMQILEVPKLPFGTSDDFNINDRRLSLSIQTSTGVSSIGRSDKTVNSDDFDYIFVIDHPYAAANGAFMDLNITQEINIGACEEPFVSCTNYPRLDDRFGGGIRQTYPLRVPFFLGHVGKGHAEQLRFDISNPGPTHGFSTLISSVPRLEGHLISAEWHYQSQQAVRAASQINNARTRFHHSIGIVRDVQRQVTAQSNILGVARLSTTINRSQYNLLSSISVQEANGDAAIEKKIQFLSATFLNAFEGSLTEQQQNLRGATSVNSILSMVNDRSTKIYEVNASNYSSFLNRSSNYNSLERSTIGAYISSGYNLVIPLDGDGGTYGTHGGNFRIVIAPVIASSTDKNRIAYITSLGGKGAAGPAVPSTSTPEVEDPRRYEPQIDGHTGLIQLRSPSIISTGIGEFPYKLDFTTEFNSESYQAYGLGSQAHGLPFGWSHNYLSDARFLGDGLRALGDQNGAEASYLFAALVAMAQFNRSDEFRFQLANSFAADWLTDQIQLNIIRINIDESTRSFYRMPNGRYLSPAGRGGAEVVVLSAPTPLDSVYGLGYEFDGVRLQLKGTDGYVIDFDNYEQLQEELAEEVGAGFPDFFNYQFFLPSKWTTSSGVSINFDWGHTHGQVGVGLRNISNSLGRKLEFNEYDQGIVGRAFALGYRISDETGRQASLEYDKGPFLELDGIQPGVKTILPDGSNSDTLIGIDTGQVSQSTLPGFANRLILEDGITLFNARNKTIPELKIRYDDFRRVQSLEDSRGHVTRYYPAKNSAERRGRGDVVDPLGNTTTTYYDEEGRPIEVITPLVAP